MASCFDKNRWSRLFKKAQKYFENFEKFRCLEKIDFFEKFKFWFIF